MLLNILQPWAAAALGAGGGSAGPGCRCTCLSPLRLTSILLFTFALGLIIASAQYEHGWTWAGLVPLWSNLSAVGQRGSRSGSPLTIELPETEFCYLKIVGVKQRVSEWSCLHWVSTAMLLCCEIICTVLERTVLELEEGMDHIYLSLIPVNSVHLAFGSMFPLNCYSYVLWHCLCFCAAWKWKLLQLQKKPGWVNLRDRTSDFKP